MEKFALLRNLAVTARRVRSFFDAHIREHGLTLPRARALSALAGTRTWTQAELAEELELERPTVVRLLDGLEKNGLLRRVAIEGDRRSKHVELTAAAAVHLKVLDELFEMGQSVLLADINQQDLEATSRVLVKILQNAEAANSVK